MAVMGSPHGSAVWQKNKLTMFGAHCPFNPLAQLAESKVSQVYRIIPSNAIHLPNRDLATSPIIEGISHQQLEQEGGNGLRE
jgi:hypothetical protein